ncbi:hypothetical protein DV096_18705 [Bradymonadaceae bacterium TMQ3]|nr:hypothetical protein DV096_18705 [Bradymonadaceae bacterium TMQ3]TXC74536.1 hypothetical protein FRC91_15600 [Bradymonadales bacterium TMQ1]
MRTMMWMCIAMLVSLAMVAGCESPSEEAPAESAESAAVEEAPAEEKAAPESALVVEAREVAALRAKIKANPGQVDALLAEAEMTQEQLEAKIFEITADPAARAAYVDASK